MATKPVPKPYQDTAAYWDAAKEERFIIQQCKSCHAHQFYPRGVCSNCLSSDLAWTDAAGTGTVYSFTVNHRAPHPGFADDVPFVTAIIELDEGPRMMSNVVGCDPESVTIGMAVRVMFEKLTDEITLPKFTPVDSPV